MGLALTAREFICEPPVAPPARRKRVTSEIDAATLERCLAGDRHALERFVLQYQDLVFAFLSRMVGRGPHVEDLAQEVFLRAHKALPRFQPRADVRVSTWLLRIAVRLVQDARKRPRPVMVQLSDDLAGDERAHPEREHRRREIARAFERAAGALPDDQRVVFVLAQFHGLSMAQIAATLDVPVNTAKTRLHRARERLRELLGAILESDHG
jgi:RNA polymerase sigma-70 factor (ECF subfamily)